MSEYIDREKLLDKVSKMIDYCESDNKVNGLTARNIQTAYRSIVLDVAMDIWMSTT